MFWWSNIDSLLFFLTQILKEIKALRFKIITDWLLGGSISENFKINF